jgi:hypothetical protein
VPTPYSALADVSVAVLLNCFLLTLFADAMFLSRFFLSVKFCNRLGRKSLEGSVDERRELNASAVYTILGE